jgi:hypothetical protein
MALTGATHPSGTAPKQAAGIAGPNLMIGGDTPATGATVAMICAK